MGSRFLSVNDSSGSLSSLQDATFDLNVKSAKIEGLTPNLPIKTDTASKKLISAKITLSDIDAPLLTNPSTADFDLANHSINSVNNINGTPFSQFVSDTTNKTLFINLPLSNDGTHFSNSVIADKFVVVDGKSNEYLMADGTTSTSSSNGQPNIYLFLNSQNIASPATTGQIRTNNARNDLSTRVYISCATRDAVNISVFLNQISTTSVLYMQDQTSANNNVRFNVIGTPIVYPNVYVDVPVQYFSSSGTGDIDLGDNKNIFMSIFTNDLAVDTRLSSLESKTHLQSSTNNITRFANTLIVDNGDPVFALPKFEVSDEIKPIYRWIWAIKILIMRDSIMGAMLMI